MFERKDSGTSHTMIHTRPRFGDQVRDLILDRCCIPIDMKGSADELDPRESRFTPIRNLSSWRVFPTEIAASLKSTM
jgi:hypothetical protein